MELSNYQVTIQNHFAKRNGHCAVIAVAGSGKTFTAINSLEKAPKVYEVLLAAFNVSIRDEFAKKVKEKRLWHIKCKNFNGFGWGICLTNVKGSELNPNKTRDIFELQVFTAQTEEEKKLRKSWTYIICRLVSLFKNNMVTDPVNQLDWICDRYAISLPSDPRFKQMLFDTYEISNKTQQIMDFDDQKWMPVLNNWNVPNYDTLVIDEFQDVCPLEMELLSRAVIHGQIYTFGDPDQAIYGFKGSTPDMFDQFKKRFKPKELPLSICYRCPINVVKKAQEIVPRIEWAPGAKEGVVDTVNVDFYLKNLRPKDFVLCRTTEPLIIDCLRLIGTGGKGFVRGRELGSQLMNLIPDNMNRRYFVEYITTWKMKKIQELTDLRRENEIINITDRVNSILAIAQGTQTTSDIKKKIESIFTDEKHDGVDYMTIHKSKGLQAETVWLLRPDLLPHPNAKLEWMMAEEARLQYVADTRSTDKLFYVTRPPR